MSHLRSRMVALTCAATLAFPLAGATDAVATGATPAVSSTVSASPAGTLDALRATHAGLDRLLETGAFRDRAIVTFRETPTAGQVGALRALGLTVQPLRRLPMALVAGPTALLVETVTSGLALDVYPDEQLTYLDTASSDVMSSSTKAARALRSKGITGKGVTVGVIDSGCDGTHPDLAEQITHNVTLVSPE
ncbi:MAG: hypothetical protein Q8O61_20645, partial [Nocardioides sp.]|nr:hypothetical protein [Nocardioides sp.]